MINNCRISGGKLTTFLDLGLQPLGNGFLTQQEFDTEFFYNLSVGFNEESMMCQLLNQPSPEQMFNEKYSFFSHTSAFMGLHFQNLANKIINDYMFSENPFIIELGSNDGILLKNFKQRNIMHLGIEPSNNVYSYSKDLGINVINKFFTSNLADLISNEYPKADVISASNVLCHIPNLLDVIQGFEKILHKNGFIIFEDPYLGDIFKKVSYDQIYDEHVFLFSAHSVINAFKKFGFNLVNIEKINTHGGSMRYYLSKREPSTEKKNLINKILNDELDLGLTSYDGMLAFSKKVENSRRELINLFSNFFEKKIKVAGYAATSKSTTILNFCDIGPDLLECIYDTTPIKIGKFSPGKHIPIIDYKNFKAEEYSHLFLFAWNHIDEIRKKEEYFSKNGKWITHVPKVEIL